MMIEIPKIETEIGQDIRTAIFHIVNKYNINRGFYQDSKIIEDSIQMITRVLGDIKLKAEPEFDKVTLKYFKKLKETIKPRKAKKK